MRFLECQALMLAPICPHFCENLWVNVLQMGKGMFQPFKVKNRPRWPEISAPYDQLLHRKFEVLEHSLRSFRLGKESILKDLTKRNKGTSNNDWLGRMSRIIIY